MKDEIIKIINNLDCKRDSRSLSIIYHFLKALLKNRLM